LGGMTPARFSPHRAQPVHNFGINRLSRPARPGPWPMLKPAWSSTIPARRQGCSPASNSVLSPLKTATCTTVMQPLPSAGTSPVRPRLGPVKAHEKSHPEVAFFLHRSIEQPCG